MPIRSLDELQKCNFESLTYGEFSEHELSCKEHCPLFGEFCNGGMSCHGGEPIEPPCVGFDDDTIMEDKLSSYQDYQLALEAQEDKRLAEEEQKKKKNAEIARKRFEYRLRNSKELHQIKALEHFIIQEKKMIRFAESLSAAINWTNKVFRESACDAPPDVKPSSKITEKDEKIAMAEKKIIELKATIKQNERNRKRIPPLAEKGK